MILAAIRPVLLALALLLGPMSNGGVAHAESADYTAADTLAAIDQYSAEIGVSRDWLYATVRCETGGTFSPYSIGRQGELGAAQLYPRGGELRRFYAWGYLDPFSPWQAMRFMAQEFSFGRSGAWSCA